MGQLDCEYLYDGFKPYAYFFAGALFGVAWWCFADAVTYSLAFEQVPFNFLWLLPGLGGTTAVFCMNCISRDDASYDMNFDEGEVGCVIQSCCICASGMMAWWWQKEAPGYMTI
eukprot:gene5529-4162_t